MPLFHLRSGRTVGTDRRKNFGMKGLFSRLSKFGRQTGKVAKMQHVFEPEESKIRHLFRFNSASVLDRFRLMTDNEVGGKTTARFVFDESLNCAVLEGKEQKKKKKKNSVAVYIGLERRES